MCTENLNNNKYNTMNRIVKTSLLAISAALVTEALQAQTNPNDGDLVVGFTKNVGGTLNDYIVDLGAVPTSTTDFSSLIASYSSVYGSLATGNVNIGAIGTISAVTGNSYGNAQAWTSTLRVGTAPTSFSTAGTEGAPFHPSNGQLDAAINVGGSINIAGSAGSISGAIAPGDASSFTSLIAQNPSTAGTALHSYASYLNSNPLSAVTASGVTTLDIWTTSDNSNAGDPTTGAWVYVGDLQLDLTGSSPTLTFDVAPVPEPTTCSLIGGLGVLALTFRRKFNRNNA